MNQIAIQPLESRSYFKPPFQTLAKVVDGWKKHESEKVTIINQLKTEREDAEQSQQRQQEVLGLHAYFTFLFLLSFGIIWSLKNFCTDAVAV